MLAIVNAPGFFSLEVKGRVRFPPTTTNCFHGPGNRKSSVGYRRFTSKSAIHVSRSRVCVAALCSFVVGTGAMGNGPSTSGNSQVQRRRSPEFRFPFFYQQGYRSGQYLMRLSEHGLGVVMVPPQVHQKAITIRNDVNLKRGTLRLEEDKENAGKHLVSFLFDAAVPGSASILFLAGAGPNFSLVPLKPHLFRPQRVTFDKGLGQRFCQLPGSGVNLSLFEADDLSKDGKDEVFSLVVRLESMPKEQSSDASLPVGGPLPRSIHAQTTYVLLERKASGQYGVRVLKQIIWVEGTRYELQEIYGVGNTGDGHPDKHAGRECVICLTNRRDTALLPCRHMCMCSECARILRFQTQRCPICRCVVDKLLEIKAPRAEDDDLENRLD
ncbi:probable E3 ubiquitin-protein ligase LUL2 [Selaginella moellendorffii]|nr:probable E3 ubiquitin-protein ligase LUL2 [Selaginella moellendorffii]|eukprot:XP_002976505.2 probable E3 ubiquitin-protein ligase LUL2 [Selaginella moellendorffii]